MTDGSLPELETVLRLLNRGLTTEFACVQRYKRHHYHYMMMATGILAPRCAANCLEHAAEEQLHADLLADRIVQLGGEPDLAAEQFDGNGRARDAEATSHVDMIREDLEAERLAIDRYAELIRYVGDDDPITKRLIEGILASEEVHANHMVNLLHV